MTNYKNTGRGGRGIKKQPLHTIKPTEDSTWEKVTKISDYPRCKWCGQLCADEHSLRDHQFNGGCDKMTKDLAKRAGVERARV